MKTSTVVKCSYKKEWQSKNGPMHSWHVTMDNGDAGEVNTKNNTPPWQVGDEADYAIEAKEYGGKTYHKITKVTPFQQGGKSGKGWTPDPERATRKERWAVQIMITRQACLNTAASLIASGCGEATVENIVGLATKLEAHVKEGLDLKALAMEASRNGQPQHA